VLSHINYVCINVTEGLQIKDRLLTPFLEATVKGLSIMDIGGNYGYFCFRSLQFGASHTTLVDMDKNYTDHTVDILAHIGEPFMSKMTIKNIKLEDDREKVDVVIALALIHWIFSCSEGTSSLAKALSKLSSKARKALIIEWVDPEDPVIVRHHHTESFHGQRNNYQKTKNNSDERNNLSPIVKNQLKSPYTYKEFVTVLNQLFQRVFYVGPVSDTRHIILCIHLEG